MWIPSTWIYEFVLSLILRSILIANFNSFVGRQFLAMLIKTSTAYLLVFIILWLPCPTPMLASCNHICQPHSVTGLLHRRTVFNRLSIIFIDSKHLASESISLIETVPLIIDNDTLHSRTLITVVERFLLI